MAREFPLENIILQSRHSHLVNVTGEDAAYVVGYYADIRGYRVSTELTRFPKDEIALRIQIGADREPAMPGPGQLSFDQNGREYEAV
jgi:hypothetical protein